MMVAFLLLFCVLFPTVESRAFHCNEKVLCLGSLTVLVLVEGVRILIPMFAGFVVFLIFAPFFIRWKDGKSA
jgi:hypothetical protein